MCVLPSVISVMFISLMLYCYYVDDLLFILWGALAPLGKEDERATCWARSLSGRSRSYLHPTVVICFAPGYLIVII